MAKEILIQAGATGATGATGETGAVGATGAQGEIGVQGETGATGAQGDIGYTGLTGATGAQGDTGLTGATGEQGIQGIQGIQGETGEQGLIGLTGADSTVAGPAGVDGTDGTNGVDGTDGLQGIQGETGEQGIQGETGVQGDTGLAGTDGIDGIDGASLVVVSQVAHGFTVPTAVYLNDSGVWQLAQADDELTLATHVVSVITDVDNFTATNLGVINIPAHGLIVDDYYFTSDVTPGAFTDVEPSLYSNPMFQVIDADNIQAYMWRPAQTGGAVGQTGAAGFSAVVVVTVLPTTPDPDTLYIII